MFKVIIADDEHSIRQGLTHILDWESLGFEICATVEDGQSALMSIEALRPHLLLLDVKMPVMDGIQLMDALKKRAISCKIIVISGYSEFEYARKALEIGAKTYMLKPVNPDDLAAQVKHVKEELLREAELSKTVRFDLEKASETVAINLLTGSADTQITDKLNQEWHFRLPWKTYQIVATTRNMAGDMNDPVRDVFYQYCRQNIYCLPFTYGQYAGLITGGGYLNSSREALYERIAIDINNASSQQHMLVAGHTEIRQQDLLTSFMKVESVLTNPFLFKNSLYLIMDNHINKSVSNTAYMNDNTMMSLSETIKNGDSEKLDLILQNIRDGFVRNMWDEAKVKHAYCELMSQLHKTCNFIQEGPSEDIENIYLEINRFNNISSLHGFIKYRLQSYSNYYLEQSSRSNITEVVSFIDKNYTNSALTLKMVSDKFWYHPTYLGVLLRKHLEKSFNQYLLELRLNQARKLLENGEKPLSVAEKSGFNDAEYFRKLFKTSFGITPSKFAKQKH